jgi:hypothetical protein
MSETQAEQDPMPINPSICPQFEAAIRNWYGARRQFQFEPSEQNQDSYEMAFNELGQDISFWKLEQPELFEQFNLWFSTHAEE